MSMKVKAAQLAAQGMPPAEIARTIGVTDSYISQIATDDEYIRLYEGLIARQQVATHSTATKIDNCYDNIELKLAETISENADLLIAGWLDKPQQLMSLVKTLNGAKRRGVGEGGSAAQQAANLVPVILPAFLTEEGSQDVQHNSNNEVVAVDGRALVSMGNTALKSKLDDHNEATAIPLVQLPESTAPLDPNLM